MARWLWHLKGIVGTLWFRATIFGIIGVFTALIAYYFRYIIPEDFSQKIGADSVDKLLNIIASTMLAVTTFSLSTMVAAYSAATNNLTPRSTNLLLQDRVSQTALSTFLGAFIYSLVGIIALRIGIYGSSGRLILFVVTVLVLALLIITLIRWIEYLSKLGRVGATIDRVEEVARKATIKRIQSPYLDGVRFDPHNDFIPVDAVTVTSDSIGYVQFIDMDAIQGIAEKENGTIYVLALPGTFVTPHRPIAEIRGIDHEKYAGKIAEAFVMADDRSFEQDPRFGLIVLSEIASRALSPAVNDPGTAIDVIGTAVRILAEWGKPHENAKDEYVPDYSRIHVPPLDYQDMFDDVFVPIARDGAALREVNLSLQKAVAALSQYPNAAFAGAAKATSIKMLSYAREGLPLKSEYDELRAVVEDSAHR